MLAPDSKSYDISIAPLTIAWDGNTLTYNGAVQRPTAIITNGLHLSDSVDLTYSNFDGVNAGGGIHNKSVSRNIDLD